MGTARVPVAAPGDAVHRLATDDAVPKALDSVFFEPDAGDRSVGRRNARGSGPALHLDHGEDRAQAAGLLRPGSCALAAATAHGPCLGSRLSDAACIRLAGC